MGNRIDPVYIAPNGTRVATQGLSPDMQNQLFGTPVANPITNSVLAPAPFTPAPAMPVATQQQYQQPAPAPVAPMAPTGMPSMQQTQQVQTSQLAPEGQAAAQQYEAKLADVQNKMASGKIDMQKGLAETNKIIKEAQNDPIINPSPEQVAAEQARIEQHQQNLANKKQEADNAIKSVKDFKFNDGWSDKSLGQKALAGVAIMLGAVGQGLGGTGGRNLGLESVDSAIQRDVELQKQQFAKLKESESQASSSYSQAMNMFKDEQAADAMIKAQKWQSVQNKLAMLRDQTNDKAKLLSIDENIAQIEQKKMENLERVYGRIQTTTSMESKNAQPTPDQLKVGTFAFRMSKANEIIDKLENAKEGGYSPASHTSALTAMRPQSMKSSEREKYEAAQDDFITAVLRPESGASISDDEKETTRNIYFPKPGEGPAVVKQKAELRRRATDGMKTQAGAGFNYIAGNDTKSQVDKVQSKYQTASSTGK